MPENPLIPSDAVQAIKDSVKTDVIEVAGRQFTTRPVHMPPQPPPIKPLIVHTLTGLVDYVKGIAEIDPVAASQIKCIHIANPAEVRVCGGLQEQGVDRHVFAEAKHTHAWTQTGFAFGEFCDAETFVIALQTMFMDVGDRPKLLQLLGNLTQEDVQTSQDDGVTQTVGTRAGVVLKGRSEVPNPVTLAPYRTFNEIDQPTSRYVLRFQKGRNLPECALFAADGDAWKLPAIDSIRRYLSDRIEMVPIIA
jgi:hypothetical protein